MSRMRVDPYHHVISKSRVWNMGILFPPRRGNRFFQHSLHLIEVEIAEQRRNHTALGNSLPPSRLEDQAEESHHFGILYPPGHLLEQQIVLHIIEVGLQVKINDERLLLHDRLVDSKYRFLRCPSRSISIRSRLEIGFEDRFQDELQRTLNHAVTN